MMKFLIRGMMILLLLCSNNIEAEKKGQAKKLSDRCENIERLFDSYLRELIKISPESAAHIGITREMGYEVASDQLDDESIEAAKRLFALKKKYQKMLKRYHGCRLTRSQRRAVDILRYVLDTDLKGEKFQHHFYILNHISGFHNSLTTLMSEYHPIANINDARAYISRLSQYQKKFLQISGRLRLKASKGLLPPAIIIKMFIHTLSGFIRLSPEQNILFQTFKKKISKLNIDYRQEEKLIQQVREKIETTIYPAYHNMIELLKKLKQKANQEVGVWKLPQGDEFYRYCLQYHTNTSLTAKQIHKIGLKEVKRIHREIKKRLFKAGLEENLPFRDLWQLFWSWQARINQDQLYYPNTVQGRIQALKDYQDYIEKIKDKLPNLFSFIPQTGLSIEAIPYYKMNTIGAYYQPASLDGNRQGIFFMNLTYLPFKPDMKTLAIHEGIPGHHFQISIEREISGIRLFRHFLFFTPYIEGWALYAEKLAMEQGWFADLNSQLGYLKSELLRAVRLVLDTGIHFKGWNIHRALSYMSDNLGWASRNEITRYIVWPGQACAYKIGELKILDLRKQAKKRLKNKFNLKQFHTLILNQGALPLGLLETYVNDYILNKESEFHNN